MLVEARYPRAVQTLVSKQGEAAQLTQTPKTGKRRSVELSIQNAEALFERMMGEIFAEGVRVERGVLPRSVLGATLFAPDPDTETIEDTVCGGTGRYKVPVYVTNEVIYRDDARKVAIFFSGRRLRAADVDVLMHLLRYWFEQKLEMHNPVFFDIERLLDDLGYSRDKRGEFSGSGYWRVRDAIKRMAEGTLTIRFKGKTLGGFRIFDKYMWSDEGRYSVKFSWEVVNLFELESYIFISCTDRGRIKDQSEFARWLHGNLLLMPAGAEIDLKRLNAEMNGGRHDRNFERKIEMAAKTLERCGVAVQAELFSKGDGRKFLKVRHVKPQVVAPQVTEQQPVQRGKRKSGSASIQSLLAQYARPRDVIDVIDV